MQSLDLFTEDLTHLWKVASHDPIRHVYELEAVPPHNRQDPIRVELAGLVTGLSFATNGQTVLLRQGRMFRVTVDEAGPVTVVKAFRAVIQSVRPLIRLSGSAVVCPFGSSPRATSSS